MDGAAVVGTSTNFSREDHVHPSDTSRAPLASPTFTGDPKAPTPASGDNDTSIATTAFVNAYAAPLDALAYNGIQVNGSMAVSQINGTTVVAPPANTTTYVLDGWAWGAGGTAVVAVAQSVLTTVFPGLPNYIGATVSTAQVTLGASDAFGLNLFIEGTRIARLAWGTANAQPITICFWTCHNRTGLYSVTVRNPAAYNRSYVATYNQNVSNAVEYKTITIPGCVDGNWPSDGSNSFGLTFTMACGSTFTAPAANTWYGANYTGAPGQVNGVAATTDAFRITGVAILPGTQAPSAARSPFIMRPFAEELRLCQRYYEKTCPYADKPGIAYGAYGAGGALIACVYAIATYPPFPPWFFKTEKRVAPTITLYSPQTGLAGAFYVNGTYDLAGTVFSTGTTQVTVGSSGSANVAAGIFIGVHLTADARL
jgi:hypothetical protein